MVVMMKVMVIVTWWWKRLSSKQLDVVCNDISVWVSLCSLAGV
jgi:hypothetical protein